MTRCLVAALIVLALATPVEAARQRRPRTVCTPTYEPGVGPGQFCATGARRR